MLLTPKSLNRIEKMGNYKFLATIYHLSTYLSLSQLSSIISLSAILSVCLSIYFLTYLPIICMSPTVFGFVSLILLSEEDPPSLTVDSVLIKLPITLPSAPISVLSFPSIPSPLATKLVLTGQVHSQSKKQSAHICLKNGFFSLVSLSLT